MVKRLPTEVRENKFVAAIVEGKSTKEAAERAGFAKNTVPVIMARSRVKKKIEEGLSEAATAAGISRAWVLSKLKEVAERCLQAQPVVNKLGVETGFYVFDASGANRSLELIGKHIKLFGDESSATAQLGAAVIRVLAQEAQSARKTHKPIAQPSVDAEVVGQEKVLQSEPEGDPLASSMADAPGHNEHTLSSEVSAQNDPPHAP